MPTALERAVEKGIDRIECSLKAYEAFSDTAHVRIVVSPGHAGRGDIPYRGSPDSGDLACGHGDTDTAPADPNAETGIAVAHRSTNRGAEVGIVDPVRRVGADIGNGVSPTLDMGDDRRLQLEPGVIASDRYDRERAQLRFCLRNRALRMPMTFWDTFGIVSRSVLNWSVSNASNFMSLSATTVAERGR